MNLHKKNFCTECGSPTEERFIGRYDPDTGEEMTKSVCQKNPCHMRNHDSVLRAWWKIGDFECKVCGEVWCVGYDY